MDKVLYPAVIQRHDDDIFIAFVTDFHHESSAVMMKCFSLLFTAYLAAEDVNIIVVDWSRGSSSFYITAIRNAVSTGTLYF